MPRRSTPFQRMVFHVQQQLSPGATVEESALLVDRATGSRREVDVVIRSGVGEHEVVVSLECLERKRKATVQWVEQMAMKHQALPTNKLVLVSASGFTSTALEKAQALAIDTYSLDAALDVDWTRYVGKETEFPLTWFEYHLWAVTLVLTEVGPHTEFAAGPSTQLWSSAGDGLGTLGEYVYPRLESWESFGEHAAEFIGEKSEGRLGLEMRPQRRFYVADPEGRHHEVAAIRAYIEFEVAKMPVGLTAGTWRGTPVGFGTGDSPLGHASITVMEPSEGAAFGAVTVPDPDSGEPQTVKLEPPPEPSAFRLVAQGGPLGFRHGKQTKREHTRRDNEPE